MGFGFQELIDRQNSAALKARYEKLPVMSTGQDLMDFWKAVPVTTFPEYDHSVRNSSLVLERRNGANKLSRQWNS